MPAAPGFPKWFPIQVFSCPMLLNSEAQLLVSPALPASGQLVGGRGEGEGQVGGEQLGADLGERLNGLSPDTRLIADSHTLYQVHPPPNLSLTHLCNVKYRLVS